MQALSTVASAARLVPGFLVVDFDGTCTVKETIGLLPRLAAHLGQESAAAAKLARFKELEEEYISGIRRVNARHDLDGPPPASLDLVTNHVGESGVLAGISPSAVAPTLAEWAADPAAPPIAELRHGCASTLGSVSAAGSRLGVLSINWSPPLIRATLSPLAAPLELWCNELQPDGSIALPVPGAAAKRARIAALVDAVCARPVVYVGDSPTDLLAMLEADVGVLIGESASARLIARRFGVRIAPLPPSLRECLAARGAQEGEVAAAADSPGVVWEAGSWEEIRRCLLGELQDPI